jgi:hypothetical protein
MFAQQNVSEDMFVVCSYLYNKENYLEQCFSTAESLSYRSRRITKIYAKQVRHVVASNEDNMAADVIVAQQLILAHLKTILLLNNCYSSRPFTSFVSSCSFPLSVLGNNAEIEEYLLHSVT